MPLFTIDLPDDLMALATQNAYFKRQSVETYIADLVMKKFTEANEAELTELKSDDKKVTE